MRSEPTLLKRARYYGSVSGLYLATLLFAWYLLNPFSLFQQKTVQAWSYNPAQRELVASEAPPSKPMVSGKPSQLSIPSITKNFSVADGDYNPADETWTITEKSAHFALPSMFANNVRGQTLIYGHYNPFVFYRLKELKLGDTAEVITTNGHVFTYVYTNVEELNPNDVSVFQFSGAPKLVLQTCSGSFYEYRSLYYFDLQKVDGQDV